MTDFVTLQNDVKTYVLDLPSEIDALVPTWINKALRDAEERHNFRYMEASETLTTTLNTRSLGSKPALWKEVRTDPYLLRDDGSTAEILWAPSESEMIRQYDDDTDDDGEPEFILENSADFDVYPYPDGDADYNDGEYRVVLPYWAFSTELSADGDTNWMTDNMRWYLTFYAAGEAELANRNASEATNMFTKAEQEFRKGKNLDKRSRLSRRITLVPRRDVYGPAVKPRIRGRR